MARESVSVETVKKQDNMIESSVKQIPHSQESVYAVLSDLGNLSRVAGNIPAGYVNDLRFDSDSVSCKADKVGEISLRIIEREPVKCIKFQTEKSPVSLTLWVQILPTGDDSSKMKLTVKAGGLGAKLVENAMKGYMEQAADLLASIPYDSI